MKKLLWMSIPVSFERAGDVEIDKFRGILLIEIEKELSLGFQITCAVTLNATFLF